MPVSRGIVFVALFAVALFVNAFFADNMFQMIGFALAPTLICGAFMLFMPKHKRATLGGYTPVVIIFLMLLVPVLYARSLHG